MAASGDFALSAAGQLLNKCKKTYDSCGGRFIAAALVDRRTIEFCASSHYQDLGTHLGLVPAIKEHFTSGLAALEQPAAPLLLKLQRDGIAFTPTGKTTREKQGRSWKQNSATLKRITENLIARGVPFVCFQVGPNAEVIEAAHPAGSLLGSVPWSAMRNSSSFLTSGSQLDHPRPSAAPRPAAAGDAGGGAGTGTAKRLRFDTADGPPTIPSVGLPLLGSAGGERWYLARITDDPTRCNPVPLYNDGGVMTWAMHDVGLGTGNNADFYVSDVHVLVSGGWL